jgi:hypothetical protein
MLPEILDLRDRLEKLSAENFVLKQHLEFTCLFEQHEKTQAGQFAAHKKHVEREITKRPVAMPLVGVVALGIAWHQTITPIRKTVPVRLDKDLPRRTSASRFPRPRRKQLLPKLKN